MSIMKNWEHLKIPFEKIDVATKNFKACIGGGGYGLVYKGVLSIDGKDTTVAVKRLNEQFGQGLKEFLTEILLLSGQKHPNLISLVGYCDEGKEKIIVYEYAERGSLDRYIRRYNRDESSTTLTWLERLKICADAARGLDHLQNHIGGHRTIIHRDIKSSNILIDETWVAKISDLGLSKLSVMGFGMSLIVSNGCGTQGYCEPEYYNSGVVTKKSDVYSFGIVLFEVLCGRLCITKPDNGFILSGKSVKEYYNNGNLVQIIDPSLREHLGSYTMTRFSEIAYRCLNDDREQRPSMDIVVKELEETLNVQMAHELKEKRKHLVELTYELEENEEDIDENWEKRLPRHYPRLLEMSDIRLNYTTKKEVYLHFCRGFLANNGQLWFSTLKSTRGICSILPSKRVFEDSCYSILKTLSLPESRFKEVKELGLRHYYTFTCGLESFMFSPVHYEYYAYYLVFKLKDGRILSNDGPFCTAGYNFDGDYYIKIRTVKPKEEIGSSTTSWVEKRDDGWLEARLTKPLLKRHLDYRKELKVNICKIQGGSLNGIIVEGVEFRPVVADVTSDHEKNEEDIDDDDDDDNDNEYWEKKLPDEYEDYIELSDIPLNYTTKKELYLLFRRGFLANNGQLWFSTCKLTRGICSILPATQVLFKDLRYRRLQTLSLPESRFKEVKKLGSNYYYRFTCRLESFMFSPQYNYACYLVFKLEDGHVLSNDGLIFDAKYNLGGNDNFTSTTLKKPKEENGSSKSIDGGTGMSKHNYVDWEKGWVEKRDDGWLEARLTKPLFKHHLETRKELTINLWAWKIISEVFSGIIVEGVEFRPLVADNGWIIPSG